MSRSGVARLVRIASGFVLGGVMLDLALRGMPLKSGAAYFRHADPAFIAVGMCFYAVALGVRGLRWHTLLSVLGRVTRGCVLESLVVGYACNNVLPARIGELVRVDYLKQRSGLGRTPGLGSVMVERLFDGMTVALSLGAGLAVLTPNGAAGREAAGPLRWIFVVGVVVMTSAVLLTAAIAVFGSRAADRLPAILGRSVSELGLGIRRLDARIYAAAACATLIVWACELTATWSVIRAIGIGLSPIETVVVLGAANLSTLLPTAPGFIGSYQLAFALCLQLFGAPRAAGVAAATLIQIFLLGSVTFIGLSIYLWRNLQAHIFSSRLAERDDLG